MLDVDGRGRQDNVSKGGRVLELGTRTLELELELDKRGRWTEGLVLGLSV